MIINNNQEEIKNVGFEGSTQMGIKDNNLHKLFKLLTTSSYKNREGSIIREYTANGLDSHISAGKLNEPVFVTFNKEDNSISILDNGLGMSEDFIRNTYMSLGESDKENSDELIGGFGIGAKSLFSYTTYYYLTSRYNNEIKSYIIADTDTGLPDVTLLACETTDQCNGVEIKFILENINDFNKFKTAVKEQLCYCENVITTGFDIDNEYKIIRGKNFCFRPDRVNPTHQLNLIWQNIVYPLDFNFLGIPPINVNCGIFFTQNTHLVPEAARENLLNTESNKKLILDKIAEFKSEIYSIWKEQQVIKSIIEWKQKGSKTIKLNDCELNVEAVLDEEYIYEPLLHTHINPRRFKKSWYQIESHLISYRKNTRYSWNNWDRAGTDSKIFHVKEGSNASNHRLSKAGWKGVFTNKTASLNFHNLIPLLYDTTDVYIRENSNNERIITSDIGIDWENEIGGVANAIWSEIEEKTIDLHSVVFPKADRTKSNISKKEVRAKFGSDNKWDVWSLERINSYRYVVYTTDETEFGILQHINYFEGYTRKNGVRQKVRNYFLPVFTNNKYVPRLSHCMTYSEFMSSNVMKKYYYRFIEHDLRVNEKPNLDGVNRWKQLTPSHRIKYKFLADYFNQKSYIYISDRLRNVLEQLHPSTHIRNEYNEYCKQCEDLRKFANSTESLRYKLLYNFTKQKLNKKQQCIV